MGKAADMSAGVSTYKERSAYWDNIKGFLILLVVFAHVIGQVQHADESIETVIKCIYLFHMPAFVFVSGYFGKSERTWSFQSIFKLIFLYFIFNSITVFVEGFPSLVEPIFSYWYLIALIVWRLTAHRIAKFRMTTVILFAAALLIGFLPSIDNHFAISRIIGFFPFYMLGYQLSEKKSSTLVSRKYTERIVLGIAMILGAALLTFAALQIFSFSDQVLILYPYEDPFDVGARSVLFIIAAVMIFALRYLSPDRNIPFLTMIGRNSLWIFVLHRLFALWLGNCLKGFPVPLIFVASVLSTIALCLIFGNDLVAKYMNKFLNAGAELLDEKKHKITLAKVAALLVALGFLVLAVFNSIDLAVKAQNEIESGIEDTDIIYPVMSDAKKAGFDNAFQITFAGDLILLEDQVNLGYTGDGYDYSDVFEYAKPYISSADLAIGVFEGPMAGEDKGYSTSNFYDGKELRLNFPDEFASAVKDAGFDLVSTANNHLLDKGEEGALRTLDVLDEIGLDHTGSYKDINDKNNNHVKLVECQGIRIAVLSYTYGSNGSYQSDFVDGKYSYLTSVIFGTSGEVFERLKADVIEDFKVAKSLSPDLIVVLPHIGTQFSNDIDEEQEVWFNIFKENGADVILGDHAHAVQPVTIEEYDGRTVFSAYCPGNFANIYREDQGDTSMLVDVYIDRDTKQVMGGSIVPLYTYAPADGNYMAVPIYSIMNDPDVRSHLTTDDIKRAEDANGIITEVVLGHQMDITSITRKYYFDENGYIRSKTRGLALTDDMKNGTLYQAMTEADSICFVGDSVTQGSKNGGCPWYEPIEEYFPDKSISNYSLGGCGVSYLTANKEHIPEADLYVIAIGTNDVRYRDESVCAMTSDSYIKAIDELTNGLKAKSPEAEFIFIAPWYSTEADPYTPLSFEEKTAMNNEYSAALEKYCADNSLMYINANGYIRGVLITSPDKTYLLDHIHPNASKGVIMYSEAVLLSGRD